MSNQIDRNVYEQQYQHVSLSTLFSNLRDSSDDDDVRPHRCSICTRGFVRQEHLNRHMRTHTARHIGTCTSKKLKSGGGDTSSITSNNNKNADTLLVNNSENKSPSALEEASVSRLPEISGECKEQLWTPNNKNDVSFLLIPSLFDAASASRTDRTGRILPKPIENDYLP
ncbi:11048_t:CDS:2, partial [Ambispora gerdemannii]